MRTAPLKVKLAQASLSMLGLFVKYGDCISMIKSISRWKMNFFELSAANEIIQKYNIKIYRDNNEETLLLALQVVYVLQFYRRTKLSAKGIYLEGINTHILQITLPSLQLNSLYFIANGCNSIYITIYLRQSALNVSNSIHTF